MRFRVPLGLWRAPQWPSDGRRRWPIVLMYHSVLRSRTDPWGLRVSPRCFYEQMAALRANADPMRLADLDEAIATNRLPKRAVVLTFDDGYLDNLLYAKPILERFGIPATVFVATGYVDSHHEFWWDELELLLLKTPRLPRLIELEVRGSVRRFDLGEHANLDSITRFRWRHWRAWHEHIPTARHQMFLEVRELLRLTDPGDRERALETLRDLAGRPAARQSHQCVSPDQLRELASGNLIEIGAHTVTHSSLAALSPQQQRQEISTSKQWLEAQIGREVTSFAYPFGSPDDYTPQTIEILQECGFQRSCITSNGSITPEVNPFEYPRRSVLDWTGREFLQRLQHWLVDRVRQAIPMSLALVHAIS